MPDNRVDSILLISIHAPAKGATTPTAEARTTKTISIHAPAKGATTLKHHRSYPIKFQSTLPRRERRSVNNPIEDAEIDFNPRSREGSDGRVAIGKKAYVNFNPRSREGSDTV